MIGNKKGIFYNTSKTGGKAVPVDARVFDIIDKIRARR